MKHSTVIPVLMILVQTCCIQPCGKRSFNRAFEILEGANSPQLLFFSFADAQLLCRFIRRLCDEGEAEYDAVQKDTGFLQTTAGENEVAWPGGGFDGGRLRNHRRMALSSFFVNKVDGDFNFKRLAILPDKDWLPWHTMIARRRVMITTFR